MWVPINLPTCSSVSLPLLLPLLLLLLQQTQGINVITDGLELLRYTMRHAFHSYILSFIYSFCLLSIIIISGGEGNANHTLPLASNTKALISLQSHPYLDFLAREREFIHEKKKSAVYTSGSGGSSSTHRSNNNNYNNNNNTSPLTKGITASFFFLFSSIAYFMIISSVSLLLFNF